MLTDYDRRLLLAHTRSRPRVSPKILVDLGSHGKKRLVKLNESTWCRGPFGPAPGVAALNYHGTTSSLGRLT